MPHANTLCKQEYHSATELKNRKKAALIEPDRKKI